MIAVKSSQNIDTKVVQTRINSLSYSKFSTVIFAPLNSQQIGEKKYESFTSNLLEVSGTWISYLT